LTYNEGERHNIDVHEWIHALLGGALIGLAVSIMLVMSGRVTGVSGIVGGLLAPLKNDWQWRTSFVAGLLLGGFALQILRPESFTVIPDMPLVQISLAGFLVGFGTLLGNGCTSGHGVCGISRFSVRSLVATGTFIAAAIVIVALMRWLRGLS
jgi:uncharacterized membrane protein YedE/YeeE